MSKAVTTLVVLATVFIVVSLVVPCFADTGPKPRVIHQVDWVERGLDPTAPGFRPEVLALAGTFTAEPIDGLHSRPAETGNFEITMRGSDHYHRIEWQDGRVWWCRIYLGVDNFHGYRGSFRKATGVGGFGSGGFGTNDWHEMARCLWAGTNLVGALPDALVSLRNEIEREEFENLEQRGPFRLPRTIVYSSWLDGRLRTYSVKKIEFRSEPTPEWYVQQRNRLFPEAPEKEREFQTGKTNWLSVH